MTLPGLAQDVASPAPLLESQLPDRRRTPIPMIGVQTTLSGDYVAKWFTDADASQPLSSIDPVAAGQDGPLHTVIYADTVFSFDKASNRITHSGRILTATSSRMTSVRVRQPYWRDSAGRQRTASTRSRKPPGIAKNSASDAPCRRRTLLASDFGTLASPHPRPRRRTPRPSCARSRATRR